MISRLVYARTENRHLQIGKRRSVVYSAGGNYGSSGAREPYGCSCVGESFSPCSVIRERGVSQLCWHGGYFHSMM
jgi:hypothetical protein